MTRQNRVTPFGEIVALPLRGQFMGNRGILHDARGEIIRPYQSKAWIICVLAFKGRRLPLMQPGHYTQLFFFDEAVALAAGHRPCFECQRARAQAFREAWLAGNRIAANSGKTPISQIDALLHAERLTNDAALRDKRKRTYTAVLDNLPNGTFVAAAATAYLVWEDALLPWSPGGYGAAQKRPFAQPMTILTPPSTVRALAAGYVPVVNLNRVETRYDD
ncbi:MAG: hypothetical protein H6660_02855 [Ardenticatenaceae bacterium]|nr:hypothetical protein [Ardenticatenaceae bacterium]